MSPSESQGGLFKSEMETLFQQEWICTPTTVPPGALSYRERFPGQTEPVVFRGHAVVWRGTPGLVFVRDSLHIGHRWETIFLLLGCNSGSPKPQLSAESQSCFLCFVPHYYSEFS